MPEEVQAMIAMFWPERWGQNNYHSRLMVMVLGAFGGFRPSETGRLRWKHVEFAKGFIYLPAERTKNDRYREIPLEPNLRAFLLALKPQGAKQDDYLVADEKVTLCLSAYVKVLGMVWKRDGLRHSYGTYSFARKDDPTGLVMAMGTTVAMLYRHYRGRVRDAKDVAAYWAIMPPSDG
jgi:integrase